MTWKCLAFSDKLRPSNTPGLNSLTDRCVDPWCWWEPVILYKISKTYYIQVHQKLKVKFRRSKTRKTIWWHSTVYCSRISIESKISKSAHKMHCTSNRANQIAHRLHQKTSNTSNQRQDCLNRLEIIPIICFIEKMTFSWFFMISTLEILQKSFKTVQTPNYSDCMSNNIWVIFVKMLHVFHFFIIVPCIFSELKLITKNLFKNTAWLSSATTKVVTLPSLTES